jgi:hypothetical protein
MRLLDVDDVKSSAVLVLFVYAIELGNLPAKRRSAIAAENQDYRPDIVLFCNSDAARVVNRG